MISLLGSRWMSSVGNRSYRLVSVKQRLTAVGVVALLRSINL